VIIVGLILILAIVFGVRAIFFTEDPETPPDTPVDPPSEESRITDIEINHLEGYQYEFIANYEEELSDFVWRFFYRGAQIAEFEGGSHIYTFEPELEGQEINIELEGLNEDGETIDQMTTSFEVEEFVEEEDPESSALFPIEEERGDHIRTTTRTLNEIEDFLITRLATEEDYVFQELAIFKAETNPAERPLHLTEFYNSMNLGTYSDHFLSYLKDEFTLFIHYPTRPGLGFVAEIKEGDLQDFMDMGLHATWEGELFLEHFSNLITIHNFSVEDINPEKKTIDYLNHEINYYQHYPHEGDLEEAVKSWFENHLPTFIYKEGSELAVVDRREEDGTVIFNFEFEAGIPGYGDLPEDETAPTSHTTTVTVEDNEVARAVTNGEFNELTGNYTRTETETKEIVIIRVGETGLNVRERPSTESYDFERVDDGEEYDLLDREGDWYKIALEDDEGWIYSAYADVEEVEVEVEREEEGEGIEEVEVEIFEEEIDFGVYYAVVDQKFILTTSMEAIEEVISRIEE